MDGDASRLTRFTPLPNEFDEVPDDAAAQSSSGVSAFIQRWFQKTAPQEAPMPPSSLGQPTASDIQLKIDVNTCADLEASLGASGRLSAAELAGVPVAGEPAVSSSAPSAARPVLGPRVSRQLSVSADDISPRPTPSPQDRPPSSRERAGTLQRRESAKTFIRKVSTTSAVGSILAGKLFADRRGLMDYDRSEFRSYWMPDSRGKECYECQDKFTAFRRRHHCRICGQIFCSRCCNQTIPGRLLGYVGELRLCAHCAEAVVQFLDVDKADGDEEGPPDDDERSTAVNGGTGADAVVSRASNSGPLDGFISGSPSTHSSVMSSGVPVSGAVSTVGRTQGILPSISGALAADWPPAADGPVNSSDYFDFAPPAAAGFERADVFQNGRFGGVDGGVSMLSASSLLPTPAGSGGGSSLLPDVIFRQPGALGRQPPAIGVVDDSEPEWLQGVKEGEQGEPEHTPPSKHISGHARSLSNATASTNAPSDSPMRRPAQPASAAMLGATGSRYTSAQTSTETKVTSSSSRKTPSPSGLAAGPKQRKQSALPVYPLLRPQTSVLSEAVSNRAASPAGSSADERDELRSESASESASECSAADGHGIYRIFEGEAVRLLKYLLQKEGLSVQQWMPAIWPLVQEIAFTVTPNVRERRDSMDVLAYVHMKTLCTGDDDDPRAQVIFGTACSKTVADRRMCAAYLSPAILLVAGSVEYERAPTAKLSAIDPVLRQETDYLRNMVLRIVSVKPQVVCVESTVARVAAQLLRDAGVTLMSHLKPAVMRRIARCTQAQIVPSIDSQLVRPTLGHCGRFACRDVPLADGRVKRLVVFEECDPDLACSVLLYANSRRQLRCAKRVMRFMVSVLYSARLETELLSLYRVCLAPQQHAPDGFLTKDNTESEVEEPNDGGVKKSSLNVLLVSDCKICNAGEPMEIKTGRGAEDVVDDESEADVCQESDNNEKDEDKENAAGSTDEEAVDFATAASDAVLTASSLIAYRVPFTEYKARTGADGPPTDGRATVMAYFKQPLYRYLTLRQARKQSAAEPASPQKINPAQRRPTDDGRVHYFVSDQLTHPFAHPQTRTDLARYRAASGLVFKSRMDAGRPASKAATSPRRRSIHPSGSGGGRSFTRDTRSPPFGSGGTQPQQHQLAAGRAETFARAHWRHSAHDEFAPAGRQALDVLSPYCHQRLAVLFASYSPKSPNAPQLCVRPWVVWMEFYGRHDMALGEFLRRYCFNAAYKCPSKGCDVSMLHHARKIVHGRTCVEIVSQSVVDLDSGTAPTVVDSDNAIIAWDWCSRCRVTSTGRPLNNAVWHLSFAKYLEYLCNGRHALSHITQDDVTDSSVCAHCLFHQHEHYFALNNHVTCFKVRPVNVYEICFAPIVANIKPDVVPVIRLVDEMKSIGESLGSVFAAMTEQIDGATRRLSSSDGGVASARQSELLVELKRTADGAHESLRERLSHAQECMALLRPVSANEVPTCDGTYLKVRDTLVRCRQLLVLSLVHWNNVCAEFNALSKGAPAGLQPPATTNGDALKRKSAHNVLEAAAASSAQNEAVKQSGVENGNGQEDAGVASGRRLSAPSSSLASLAVSDLVKDLATHKEEQLKPQPPATNQPTANAQSLNQNTKDKDVQDLETTKKKSAESALTAKVNGGDAKNTPTKGAGGTLSMLASPFDPLHHYALPAGRLPVVVKERDVGSIIAYTLASNHYETARIAARDASGMEGVPTTLKMSSQQRHNSPVSQSSADLAAARRPPTQQQPQQQQQQQQLDPSRLEPSGGESMRRQRSSAAVCDTSADSSRSQGSEPKPTSATAEHPSSSALGERQHVEVQFGDHTARYYCKVYYAEHFRLMRKLLFADGEDAFVRSLGNTDQWHPKGGKSGASFHRTADGRFVLKQLSRFEMHSFLKFAPNYFHYLSTAATENKLTTLAKIFGVYRIGYRNNLTNSAAKMDLLVMEYLFYQKNIKRVYDLKGSLRNRMASEKSSAASDLVLLDENFLKELWKSQFYVHAHAKAALNAAVCADAHFLAANGVMDYSLLVGTDEDGEQLVVGIVDYMRTYTLDKKVESWVKIVAVPGAHLPTILSPELYCGRFAEAIDTYFAVSPDQWAGLAHGIPY